MFLNRVAGSPEPMIWRQEIIEATPIHFSGCPARTASVATAVTCSDRRQVKQIPNDAQLVMGDRWIKGKWGKSPIYDGIQGYKKALHVNRRPQIYINTLRSCHTYADELKQTIQEIPCTGNSSALSGVDIPLIVEDPAFFPLVYLPSFSHATIEFDLLNLPLELKSNVGFTLVFYTKEIGRQRKQHSAVLNPSSFEIKDSDASEHRGLLEFTWSTANATYIQFGAAILNGRFDRYYYYQMFVLLHQLNRKKAILPKSF